MSAPEATSKAGLFDGLVQQLLPMALLGLMAFSVYGSFDAGKKTDLLDQKLGTVAKDISRIEQSFSEVQAIIREAGALKVRVDAIEGRVDRMAESSLITRKDLQALQDRANAMLPPARR